MTSTTVIDNDTLDRIPPQDRQAEMSVLGALMVDNKYIDAVAALITPDDFYERRHGKIFAVMLEMSQRNIPVDILTISDELLKIGELENFGGRSYLVECQEDLYSAANIERYAQIIAEKSSLRQLMHAAAAVYRRAQDNEEPKELIEFADRSFFQIASKGKSNEIRTQLEVSRSFIGVVDEAVAAKDTPEIRKRWLRTGLTELDNMLFKLDAGLMTIVAARPGDGKTVLTLQICDWLDRCGTATAFVSLEMPEEQMLLRLATTKTEIPMWKIRTGDLSDQELSRVYDEAARYGSGECKLHLDHIRGKKTPFEVRRRLRYFKREFDIKLAVVDYVQLLSAPGRKWGTRNEELTFISSFLMETASELGIHLIDVSQLSRPDKGQPDREPQLESLRDCGGLEQDANNVIFIWHPYRTMKDRVEYQENYAHIILRKQRQGPTGTAKLYWDAARVRFNSMLETIPV